MKKKLMFLFIIATMLFSIVGINASNEVDASTSVYVDKKLREALSLKQEVYQVIVTFKEDGPVTEAGLDLLKNLGIDTGISMKSLPIVGILATKDQVEKLSEQDQILSLYLNEKLEYFNSDSTAITGVEKVRTDQTFQKINNGLPFSGKDIGVVINDSGVDGTHKDLEFGRNLVQNVLASTNLNSLSPQLLPITYKEDVVNTDTNSGHGTHVAGTVGGTGTLSGGKYEGVAPGADLIGYGSGAALFILDGIGGFDYAITHQQQYNIRVITNSWGSSGDFEPSDPINIASKKAYDRGITVLFAAGNSGPGENTHNPYAKAPWVVSVGAGVKDGTLADFSSRGTKGVGGTFEVDGKEWTWEDRPTLTAPGVDIISTRTIAPVALLGADKDAELIEPAYLPHYTTSSGTSMATPHVAGIVALLLEADPTLSPEEIKDLLQKTATNMPGYEEWEVGAGYVNAYTAIDSIVNNNDYGKTVNMYQEFNSSVDTNTTKKEFIVDYNPLTFTTENQYAFEVAEGLNTLTAQIHAKGLLEETGNPINLILVDPSGKEYSSGISLLFPLTVDRTVVVQSPVPGSWKVKISGLRGNEINPVGLATSEEVKGTLSFTKVNGFNGLGDITGHPAENAIKLAVNERLVDGFQNGLYKPDTYLSRADLAKYLVIGAEVRQNLTNTNGVKDVSTDLLPFASAVVSKGAAFRDGTQTLGGVMKLNENQQFAPKDSVLKSDLAYSLVQALGLEKMAKEFDGDVTVVHKEERVPVLDTSSLPNDIKGYVQLAIDLNILNVKFEVVQGPYDLEPKLKAYFQPNHKVTRGDYAVAVTRYQKSFLE
ncbi:S8 family serine peptidase [Metabacillus herbersteinensis]|uniref:S8 family serine peptidase n=1 Tax=Metabacillus herbersteinensis TaxID=283816 RepID=A0ABV6GH86_9BACI